MPPLATPEQLLAALNAVVGPESAEATLDAIVSAEITRRRVARNEEREREREHRAAVGPQPATGLFAAVTSGRYERTSRPRTSAEDRLYVPGALHHWRRVHGHSQKAAQAAIGYSPNGKTWGHWEAGFTVPPYSGLLRVISATGLGYVRQVNAAAVPTSSVEADLLLEAVRADHERTRRRRT